MAATDSYRLSFKETELEQPGPDLEAIIPARALTELGRIAAGTETVALGVNENTVVFGTRRHVADDAPHRRPVPGRRRGCCPSRSRSRSTCRAPSSARSSAAPA